MTDRAPLGRPLRSRRQQVVQALLILVVLGATGGILRVVLQSNVLLGRMTTDVSVAQQRATNLANTQRESLRLLQELTELGHGGSVEQATIRRGTLARQLSISSNLFEPGSSQHRELTEVRAALARFPWERLTADAQALRAPAMALVSQVEVRLKALYNDQEKYFYEATLQSLEAKQDNERALVALVALVLLLGVGWVVLLKRRTRSDLDRAYEALLTSEERFRHQAYHDTLTGLPNRALYVERLTGAIKRSRANGGSTAAVLVDLDGFKNVNDTFGHPAGDELLQRAAERLRGCILEGDTVARLGGDEFAIVLPAGTVEHAAAVSRRVIAALRRPVRVAGQEVRIGASIGIAMLADHRTAEELLGDADIAMYAAKRGGKARAVLFEQAMRARTLHRTKMEQELALAVALGHIEVHYQPIVDLASRSVTAVEALARWRRAGGELVQPSVFIPIAEETGLIGEIGDAVLRRACATVQDWRRTIPGCSGLGVTVNVSGWQIQSADYSTQVADVLAATGLPPAALTLEITESMLLEDSDRLAQELAALKALKVRLAMDDFGAGYSSLSSLMRFKVDTLKIDRMFLDLSVRNQGSLVRAVAEMGHGLGLTVVAEGVETAAQLALARAARCDAVQGFLVSKPLPGPDARLFLEWAATTDEIARLLTAATVSSA